MKGMFEIADRDGDGKVTKKEFDDAVDLQAGAVRHHDDAGRSMRTARACSRCSTSTATAG